MLGQTFTTPHYLCICPHTRNMRVIDNLFKFILACMFLHLAQIPKSFIWWQHSLKAYSRHIFFIVFFLKKHRWLFTLFSTTHALGIQWLVREAFGFFLLLQRSIRMNGLWQCRTTFIVIQMHMSKKETLNGIFIPPVVEGLGALGERAVAKHVPLL